MGRNRELSEHDRWLLDEIDRMLGDSPKGRLAREIVEQFPDEQTDPRQRPSEVEVPEAD